MTTPNRRRGARPSPRHALLGATPHRIVGATPDRWYWLAALVSMWLNDVEGDCVTAEEALARALSGVFIKDETVQAWAQAHGVTNGAVISDVLDWMAAKGFSQDGNLYNAGAKQAVDYSRPAVLTNAIWKGPVKIGVAADQLQQVVGEKNGWFGLNFRPDQNLDHCVALTGYGPLGWLAQALGATLPAGADPNAPGYHLYTWKTFGVIDHPSMLAITGEAWLRTPTTVTVGTNPPTPDAVSTPDGPAPQPSPAPPPVPAPPPAPVPVPPVNPIPALKQRIDAIFAQVEAAFRWYPAFAAVLRQVQAMVDAALDQAGYYARPRLSGHVPPGVILIIDGAFKAAAAAYPQFAVLLGAAQAIIDQLLPLV